jgi:Kdo2-lipid IVA lauroyltransferase/acyltransferase
MSFFRNCISFLFELIGFLFFYSPVLVKKFFAQLLAWLWWDVFRLRRFSVLKNICVAFPHLGKTEKHQLARQSLFHLAYGFFETLALSALNRKNIDAFIELHDFDRLQKLIETKQGVLLMSLHLGNGDVGAAALSLKGVPLHLISKQFRNRTLNEAWFSIRKKMGTKFIAPHGKDSAFVIMKALGAGDAVCFVIDQFMGRPYGIPNSFFGRVTATAYGLAAFAARETAPVVPIYCYRDKNLKMHLQVGDPIEFEKNGDKQLQISRMTQKYSDVIESLVRRHPEQWMWVHRRWKVYE